MMLTASFFSLTSVIIFLSNYISFNVIEKNKRGEEDYEKEIINITGDWNNVPVHDRLRKQF